MRRRFIKTRDTRHFDGKQRFDSVNVIRDEGVACISMDYNIFNYYAKGIPSRKLIPKVYRFPVMF